MTRHQPPRGAAHQGVLDAPPKMVADQSHLHPRPRMLHVRVNAGLVAKIGNPFDLDEHGPGGWWIGPEPELHPGGDVLLPDVAGWRRVRMPVFPDRAAMSMVPDRVCDVLLPRTRRAIRPKSVTSMPRMASATCGSSIPMRGPCRPLPAPRGGWVQIATLADDAEVCVAPFDAITWPLSALWPRPRSRILSDGTMREPTVAKTTSAVLGDHFDGFVAARVGSGRHASASDLVREGLRLAREREARLAAIDAGLASPDATDVSRDRVGRVVAAAARG